MVTVRNFNGKIAVKSWQKNEVVVVADHTSEKTEVDADQAGNRIDVITHHVVQNATPDELLANYEITVPEETELQVRTDSGWVIVERVAGDMTINTVAANAAGKTSPARPCCNSLPSMHKDAGCCNRAF